MKTTLTLTPEDVIAILKRHLDDNGIEVVGGIELEIGKKHIGNQMDSAYVPVFKGAICEVDIMKPKPTPGPIIRQ